MECPLLSLISIVLYGGTHCDLIVRLNDDCLDVTGCHGVTGPGVASPDHITSSVRFPNDN